MKKLRITIENKVYYVTVEVLEDDEQHVPGAGMAMRQGGVDSNHLQRQAPSRRPPSIPVGASSPAPQAPAQSVNPAVIKAPIAGNVQKVFVEAGSQVEAKAPVILLDAMKMDTYIYSSRTGKVKEVCVSVGDAVQVGDVLIRYHAEE